MTTATNFCDISGEHEDAAEPTTGGPENTCLPTGDHAGTARPKTPSRRSGPPKGRTSGRCSICKHADRYRIELALVGGAGRNATARKFAVGMWALDRHMRNHVSAERRAQMIGGPVKLAELADRAAEEGCTLLDYLSMVRSSLMSQFLTASEVGDRMGSSMLAGKLLECLRIIAQMTGELRSAGATVTNSVAIINSPFVADLQSMLLRTLAPFPDARKAVIAGLEELSCRAVSDSPAPRLPALEHAHGGA
jgi:hypothetical protein